MIGALRRRLAALARDASHLLVPLQCAGCGAFDVDWCLQCQREWRSPGIRAEHGAGRLDRMTDQPVLPVWARARYQGSARSVIVAAKDGGRHDLHRPLCEVMRAEAVNRRSAVLDLARGRTVVVAPVPSSARSIRVRGADFVDAVAQAAAAGLGVSRRRLFLATSTKRDQVGLGRGARQRNVRAALRLRSASSELTATQDSAVVLVDDVMTTGATLATCMDLLSTRQIPVVGGGLGGGPHAAAGGRVSCIAWFGGLA